MQKRSVHEKTEHILRRRVLARFLAEDLRRIRGGDDLEGEVIFTPGPHLDTSASAKEGILEV